MGQTRQTSGGPLSSAFDSIAQALLMPVAAATPVWQSPAATSIANSEHRLLQLSVVAMGVQVFLQHERGSSMSGGQVGEGGEGCHELRYTRHRRTEYTC